MRTARRPASRLKRFQAVLFIVLMGRPRCGNTQIGSRPRCACTIDQAASFRITTCARLDLNASGGITNTLRPTSGTGTSHSHSSPHTLLSRKPVLTAKSAIRPRRAELGEESVLLLPGDRVGQTRSFGQHRDHWRHCVEPRTTVVIAIGPSRAIQDRSHHLEAAIDRGRGYACRDPVRNKRFECAVMDSIDLKVSEIWQQQANVPSDQTNASLVLRLGEVTRRAVRKPRTGSSLVLELRSDAGYFGIEAVFGILLAERPEAKINAYTTMFLVDGEITVGVDGNALRAGRSHDVPLRTWDAGALSEGSGAGAKVKLAAEEFWR